MLCKVLHEGIKVTVLKPLIKMSLSICDLYFTATRVAQMAALELAVHNVELEKVA